MELQKRRIETSVIRTRKEVQITLDRDMNVPDSRPDMEKLIQNKGDIQLEEIEVMNERIKIKGSLQYKGLYYSAEAGPLLGSLTGSFELDEYINIDGITSADKVKAAAEVDDLNVIMIHSRKLGIRALITFYVQVYETAEVECAVEANEDSVQQLFQEIHLTQQAFQKRDTCRIKGEMTLAASKPNVKELIWDEASLRNSEVRMMEGKIQVRGELTVFYLYRGEENHIPIQHVEWEVPFSAEVECPECSEEMIGDVKVTLGFCQLEIKPDEDGEERVLSLEAILNLDMKGYKEEHAQILADIYSTEKEIIPQCCPFPYENLLLRNNAKTKVQRRIRLKEEEGKILQLIHVAGTVKIDEMERREGGIYVEGVVLADLMALTKDDRTPLWGLTQILPFSHLVEAKKIGENDRYSLEAELEQIQGVMMGSEEVELKAVIGLSLIAFSVTEGRVITEIKEKPYDYEARKKMPGIAVYIAEKEEPIWNVAKRYGSSVESIKQMNQLECPVLKKGQKIIISKKVREVL